MSVLDVLLKYGLDKFDKKFFQEEKLSVQDHVHVLYKIQKTMLEIDKFITDEIEAYQARYIMIQLGTLSLLMDNKIEELELTDNKMEDFKKASEATPETVRTLLNNFIHHLDNNLPGTAKEIAEARDLALSRIWNHVEKLLFFFEMEGFPDLGNEIFRNFSQFITFYNDIKQKLPDLRIATETARDEREIKRIEKKLLKLFNRKELVDKHNTTMKELMTFATKKNWDQIFPSKI